MALTLVESYQEACRLVVPKSSYKSKLHQHCCYVNERRSDFFPQYTRSRFHFIHPQASMNPSLAPTDEPTVAAAKKVRVDYMAADYRGFLFVVHESYGMLLLHCTRKKRKPPHWQVPGGHIDEREFLQAGTICKKWSIICALLLDQVLTRCYPS
jgi:hypothetical protein